MMEEKDSLLFGDENERKEDKRQYTIQFCIGVSATLGYAVLQTVSATCVQLLRMTIPPWEIITLRSFTSVFLLGVLLAIRRKSPLVSKEYWLPVFYFSVAYIGFGMVYIPVDYLPLGTSESIRITSTLIFSVLLFRIFLKEIITYFKLCSTVLCLVGVILMIQPKIIFGGEKTRELNSILSGNETYNTNTNIILLENKIKTTIEHENIGELRLNNTPLNVEPAEKNNNVKVPLFHHPLWKIIVFGYIFLMIASSASAMEALLLQKTNLKDVDPFVLMFWSWIPPGCVALIVMLITEKPVYPDTFLHNLFLLGNILSAVPLNVFFIVAGKRISGSLIMSLSCILVLLMLISQYTILKHINPGHSNWLEVVGAVVVFSGSVISPFSHYMT